MYVTVSVKACMETAAACDAAAAIKIEKEYVKIYSGETENQSLIFPIQQIIWSQSFTSLKADLCQDMNKVSSLSRCLNGTFP